MSLFPDLAPAPLDARARPRGSLDYWQQLEPKTTSLDPGAAAPAARPRRRVVLPARTHARRNRRDPDEVATEEALRAELKTAAADAIRSVMMLVNEGHQTDRVPELFDPTPTTRTLSDGRTAITTRGAENRNWLYGQAGKLDGCHFVEAYREAQCGQFSIEVVSCHVRACPSCERARSAKLVRTVQAFLEQHVAASRRSYLTVTIRNVLRLAGGLDRLHRGIGSLRRRPIFAGGRCRWRLRNGRPGHPCARASCSRWSTGRHRADRNCPDFRHHGSGGRARPVEGGMFFTEVTFNVEQQTWHPHANLLLDAGFVLQEELADTWRAITCSDPKHRRAGWCPKECEEGSPVVWIEQVDPHTVREAIKYVCKPQDLIEGDDPLQLIEFLFATKGRRMVQGFGSMFGLEIVAEDSSENETVTKLVPTGHHDRSGHDVYRRVSLARFCLHCGRDTKIGDDCTYDMPITIPRLHVRLRDGVATWVRPPRPPGEVLS